MNNQTIKMVLVALILLKTSLVLPYTQLNKPIREQKATAVITEDLLYDLIDFIEDKKIKVGMTKQQVENLLTQFKLNKVKPFYENDLLTSYHFNTSSYDLYLNLSFDQTSTPPRLIYYSISESWPDKDAFEAIQNELSLKHFFIYLADEEITELNNKLKELKYGMTRKEVDEQLEDIDLWHILSVSGGLKERYYIYYLQEQARLELNFDYTQDPAILTSVKLLGNWPATFQFKIPKDATALAESKRSHTKKDNYPYRDVSKKSIPWSDSYSPADQLKDQQSKVIKDYSNLQRPTKIIDQLLSLQKDHGELPADFIAAVQKLKMLEFPDLTLKELILDDTEHFQGWKLDERSPHYGNSLIMDWNGVAHDSDYLMDKHKTRFKHYETTTDSYNAFIKFTKNQFDKDMKNIMDSIQSFKQRDTDNLIQSKKKGFIYEPMNYTLGEPNSFSPMKAVSLFTIGEKKLAAYAWNTFVTAYPEKRHSNTFYVIVHDYIWNTYKAAIQAFKNKEHGMALYQLEKLNRIVPRAIDELNMQNIDPDSLDTLKKRKFKPGSYGNNQLGVHKNDRYGYFPFLKQYDNLFAQIQQTPYLSPNSYRIKPFKVEIEDPRTNQRTIEKLIENLDLTFESGHILDGLLLFRIHTVINLIMVIENDKRLTRKTSRSPELISVSNVAISTVERILRQEINHSSLYYGLSDILGDDFNKGTAIADRVRNYFWKKTIYGLQNTKVKFPNYASFSSLFDMQLSNRGFYKFEVVDDVKGHLSREAVYKILTEYKVITSIDWLSCCHRAAHRNINTNHVKLLIDNQQIIELIHYEEGFALVIFDDGSYQYLIKELTNEMKEREQLERIHVT